ncbi:MAG: hypothetical protein K2I82_01815 [Ruminococcus sp.]|nr:hypothetical protein [Ruminococcus sp.]
MMICRTPDTSRLGSKFIKAKPVSALLWIFTVLVLCAFMATALIISDNPETVSWIFLAVMIFYITLTCSQVKKADIYFNSFILNDKGELIFINLGNIFMNSRLFGGQHDTVNTPLKVFIEWFKTAERMKIFRNEQDFDTFIMSNSVLNLGHYVKKIFSVKSNRKYIIIKVRLKQCNAVQSNILTEFTKTISIPKNFKNAGFLETELRSAIEKQP